MIRLPGFYWTRWDGNDEWGPSEWDGDYWYNIDYDGPISSEPDQVGPRLEPPK